MNTFQFTPQGVCARNIQFSLDENNNVKDVSFYGGCNGNLKAISKLIDGKPAQEVIDVLKGNDCAGRGTSCADQLAIALEQAMEYEA
ncbi:MAG: TIGR03905 family TSCPD domain-containing protein [Clostridia bacterium]|nr:TIGR03905 family TSCPD domain-containing protein [Clostridia bacterium]MBP5271569.1 TIGR03905 family TSCPD domain-containing protein [Clostridia bacterium]MBP5460321.1 TIGR03905 family TSCPD domain-containing protein [Clostridia bacterium]